MIDPAIPLSVKAPPQFDAMRTLGEMQVLQHGKQQMDMNKLNIQEKERTLKAQGLSDADDAAIRAELANQANAADPNNLDAVADRLDAGGHGPAAMKFRGTLLDHRKKQADGAHTDLSNMEAANKIQAGILGSVNDEATWQSARKMMRATVQAMGKPEALQQFDAQAPESYDPDWVKTSLTALTDHATQVREKRYSVLEHQWALEHGQPDKDGKFDPKALDVWASSAGRVLSQAKNADEWGQALQGLRAQGAPDAVLNRFDSVWSKDSAKRAADATMTPEQLRRLGILQQQANTAAANSKRGQAEFDDRKAHRKPTPDDPNFAHDMQEYNAYSRNHHASQGAKKKAFHDKLFSDPDADVNAPPPAYEDPMSFEDWRKKVKGRTFQAPVADDAGDEAADDQQDDATPAAPPAAAAPPPVAPPAPARAPAAPAKAAPAKGGAKTVSISGLKVTIPGVDGKPAQTIQFKDEATMNQALKEAGYGAASPTQSGKK